MRQRVPADVADLFAAPGEGPPPERASSAASDLPTELTEAEVATALQRLPGWTGDTHRLSRTVVLPEGLGQRALDRIAAGSHQHGTARMGHDPQTSVLDANCRAHEVENLYVVDGSPFPTATGANPTLTIMANAWRVAEHIVRGRGR